MSSTAHPQSPAPGARTDAPAPTAGAGSAAVPTARAGSAAVPTARAGSAAGRPDGRTDAREPTPGPVPAVHPAVRGTSRVAAALLGAVGGFQLALAAGAPWGEAAWGGASPTLPAGLRVASGVAAVVWSGAALVVLRQGGHETWAPVPDRWLRRTTIVLAAYSGVGVLLNLASRSELERALWTPTTLAMAVTLTVCAARGRRLRTR